MVFKNKKPGILTYNYSVIIHVNFMELNQKTPKRGRASTWSPEDLQKALEALRNKYGLNEVSRLYGIPKPTLKRHLDGKNKFANGNVVQRVINIPVEPIPSTSNSQHDQLLVQSSSDSSTIVATSPLTSSNEPRFGATAQSSINSNYSYLELSISAYNAIPTEPDGRCFF
ncbi:tigger transposable element-derived protein 6 [Biomphalaria glabrata]|nr:jerky protein-like [Biomphalaria glabrata]